MLHLSKILLQRSRISSCTQSSSAPCSSVIFLTTMTIIALGTLISFPNISARAITLSDVQYTRLYIWAAVALPIVTCGAFGNILTLVVILRAKWYATGIQVLILTLTICGVVTTSVIYPLLIIGTVIADTSLWRVPGVCLVTGYLFYSVTCMIPTTCAMIAINRFCIILLPSQTRIITQKNGGAAMSLISCAVSLVTFAFPLLQLDGRFGLIEPVNICIWQQWTASQEFQTGFILVIYVIPGIAIAFCYVAIFFFMRVGACAGRRSGIAANPETGRLLHRLLQVTKMMGVTFSVYVLCYLPLNIMAWGSVHVYVSPQSTVYAWLLLLYFTSDCLHPVIYAAMNQDFRNAYMELLLCCRVFQNKSGLRFKEMVHNQGVRNRNMTWSCLPRSQLLDLGSEEPRRSLIPVDFIPRETVAVIVDANLRLVLIKTL